MQSIYDASPDEHCQKCKTLLVDWEGVIDVREAHGPCPSCVKGTLKESKSGPKSFLS